MFAKKKYYWLHQAKSASCVKKFFTCRISWAKMRSCRMLIWLLPPDAWATLPLRSYLLLYFWLASCFQPRQQDKAHSPSYQVSAMKSALSLGPTSSTRWNPEKWSTVLWKTRMHNEVNASRQNAAMQLEPELGSMVHPRQNAWSGTPFPMPSGKGLQFIRPSYPQYRLFSPSQCIVAGLQRSKGKKLVPTFVFPKC